MKWGEDEVEGLGFCGCDEPQAFFTSGIEESGNPLQVGEADPGFDLE